MQQQTPAMRRCRQCVPTRVCAPRRPAAAAARRRPSPRLPRSTAQRATRITDVDTLCAIPVWAPRCSPSQRSLHNAPIFRLLLKVAVNGTHQCGFINFCGALWAPTVLLLRARTCRKRCARACVPRALSPHLGGVHCRVHPARVAQRSTRNGSAPGILAEGAIALSVTLSGGALFAS